MIASSHSGIGCARSIGMNKMITDKLTRVAGVLESLDAEQQKAVLAEIEEHVEAYTHTHVTPAQRDEVKRRLTGPRQYVSDAEIEAIFRRFTANA